MNVSMIEWMECIAGWMSTYGWINGFKIGWIDLWSDEYIYDWINVSKSKWMDLLLDIWICNWMNGSMIGRKVCDESICDCIIISMIW